MASQKGRYFASSDGPFYSNRWQLEPWGILDRCSWEIPRFAEKALAHHVFFHCLRQELDNCWMKIVTDQYPARGSEKRHVIGWIGRINFKHALWQYQPN